MGRTYVIGDRCPRRDSPQPHLHPAEQANGEVQLCPHEYHWAPTPSNRANRWRSNQPHAALHLGPRRPRRIPRLNDPVPWWLLRPWYLPHHPAAAAAE
jgi:hypothetical protein